MNRTGCTIRRIQCGTDNCYIVAQGNAQEDEKEGGKACNAILVDTCSAAGYEKVLAACSAYAMKLIVLTTDYLLLVIAVAVLFVYIAGVLLFFGMRRKRSPGRRVRRIIGIVLSLVFAAAFLR